MNSQLKAAVDCKDLKNIEDIRDEIATGLKFPGYYGRGWDAWDDCMKDMDWIKEKEVIVSSSRLQQHALRTLPLSFEPGSVSCRAHL